MLGLDQVQQMHLKQKELRIEENSPPVSYYPLKLGKSVVKFKILVYIKEKVISHLIFIAKKMKNLNLTDDADEDNVVYKTKSAAFGKVKMQKNRKELYIFLKSTQLY